MSARRYHYETNCVACGDGDAIRALVDSARPVTWRTFAANCDWRPVAEALGYATTGNAGLRLSQDFCVSFHRGVWNGRPCYYFRWSGIEHIFTNPETPTR
jgi:hypothetical protein